jgi:pimeloyl-ACP methyl ester carboxylesterase
MLPYRIYGNTAGDNAPTLFLLHWLSGSARTWTEVAEALAPRGLRCIVLDLHGFGDAAPIPGYTLAEMTAAVTDTIRALHPHTDIPWLIAGHSMGGKVAALIARESLTTPSAPQNLRGLILVSPSPPGPEPMKDSKRQQMLDSLGQSTSDPKEDRKRAAAFVDDNTGKPALTDAVRDRTTDDVLRMNRAALRAWLQHGSKEDHATTVGILSTPALLIAGTKDAALGPDAQRKHTLPHLANAELIELKDAAHLAPLERAAELVELITTFIQRLGIALQPATETTLTPAFDALLNGPRTAPQTRDVLTARLHANDAAATHAIDLALTPVLRALADTVIPSPGFDLAARLDHDLTSPTTDGWRFDTLPSDPDAWRRGLTSLDAAAFREHNLGFAMLTPAQRHALLESAQQGKLGKGVLGKLGQNLGLDKLGIGDSADLYTAPQMQQWFEDARAHLTRLYVADPRTLERIGFTGFADEGGFTQIQLNQRETFEL